MVGLCGKREGSITHHRGAGENRSTRRPSFPGKVSLFHEPMKGGIGPIDRPGNKTVFDGIGNGCSRSAPGNPLHPGSCVPKTAAARWSLPACAASEADGIPVATVFPGSWVVGWAVAHHLRHPPLPTAITRSGRVGCAHAARSVHHHLRTSIRAAFNHGGRTRLVNSFLSQPHRME